MSVLSLGQEKVGIPQMEAVEALLERIEQQNWEKFDKAVVMYYFERMNGNHLLNLIQGALDEAALKKVDPNEVRLINLLLLRDHFRHNAAYLRPDAPDSTWIDELYNPIFEQFKIPEDRYRKFAEKFDLENISENGWSDEVSKYFGIMPQKLFICHASIVSGIEEDLYKKPWWKFW